MFCSNCGNKLPDNAKFCGNCGERVDQEPESQSVLNNQPRQALISITPYLTEKNRKLIAIALFCLTTAVELFFLWSLCFTQLSSAKGFFSYDAAAEYADRYSSSSWSSDSFGYLSNGVFDMYYTAASEELWNKYQLLFSVGATLITLMKLSIGYSSFYNGYKKRKFEGENYIELAIIKLPILIGVYFWLSYLIKNSQYGTYINCSGLLLYIIIISIASILCGAVYHNAASLECSNKNRERQNQYQSSQSNS